MAQLILVSYFLFSLWTTIGFSQAIPDLVAQQGYADSVVVNGKIVSMDDRSIIPDTPGGIYQAMAIKGKRVMGLGTNDEMVKLTGPRTRKVDVGGRTVIPGLVQTHYHIFSPAAARYGPQVGLTDPSVNISVVAEATAEATAKKVRESILNAIRVQQIPKGKWISVNLEAGANNRSGTVRTWLYTGKINRRQFDSAIQEHPIMIRSRVAGIFNQTAITEFKKVFPDWEESTNLENGPGSASNGYAPVPELQGLTFEFWWKDEPVEKIARAMRLQGLELQKLGITTVSTRILFPRVIAAFHHLNREGQMPHRLAYYVESQRGNFFNLKSMREFYKGYGAPWTTHRGGGEMLWLGGMANEIWDASDNEVCMGPDVLAPPEIKSRERCPKPGSKPWESYKTAIVHGWRPVQAHSTSSHGMRLYIQMLEEAMREGNYSVDYMRDLRTAVEHNQLLGTPPDVMEGIKKFGIHLNVVTFRLLDIPSSLKDYGEQLRPFIMPVKSWINQGIRVTFEADGTNFWRPIYRLVTREITLPSSSEKMVLQPKEAIDRVTALKMATTWASEYMLAEDTIGTLEAGKYADFAVLNRDFFTIPIEEVPDIRVVMTGLNGELVWDGDQLSGSQ
ncbi:MAG: amidohydrolase family protein [Acidobacteriota bacterium]|nr:amidohydrolase family protein [Acidobacteriota bacterium]